MFRFFRFCFFGFESVGGKFSSWWSGSEFRFFFFFFFFNLTVGGNSGIRITGGSGSGSSSPSENMIVSESDSPAEADLAPEFRSSTWGSSLGGSFRILLGVRSEISEPFSKKMIGGGGSSSSSKTEIGDSDFLDPVDPVDSSELSMVWHPDSQVTVFFLFLEPFGRPRPRLIMGLRISGFSNMIVGVGKMVGKSGSETEAEFWVCALVVCWPVCTGVTTAIKVVPELLRMYPGFVPVE